MKVMGSPGTIIGLLLRIGRCLFSFLSMYFIFSDDWVVNFTVIIFSMGAIFFNAVWSFFAACYDIFSLRKRIRHHGRTILTIAVIGELLATKLLFAAVSSSTAVTIFLARDSGLCAHMTTTCHRYFMSIWMAAIALLFSVIICLSTMWVRASM